MSVRIITDSTSDLTPEVRARVGVIPLSIRFGEEEYIDGVTITTDEFYRKLSGGSVLPTTSQATPASFEKLFRETVEAGDTAVVITIASGLSGTYQSGVIAAEDYPGKIFVVDSENVAIGAGILVEYALKLADQGMEAGRIAAELTKLRSKVCTQAPAPLPRRSSWNKPRGSHADRQGMGWFLNSNQAVFPERRRVSGAAPLLLSYRQRPPKWPVNRPSSSAGFPMTNTASIPAAS